MPSVSPPPTAQAAIADLRAEIREQAYAGQLDPQAGLDLLDKVDQIAHEVSEAHWAAARDLVHKVRDKLDKLRHDGLLTSTGYQTLIVRVDVLDKALA